MNTPSESGIVFNIQRFSIHDGPGIRTVVFLKGCPMRCVWCHNPESFSKEPEISYAASLCIGCGTCIEACPSSCHSLSNERHMVDFSTCILCGACEKTCPTEAIKITGKKMTSEEVMREVLADKVFYADEGGLTLSGGEPLMQPTFAKSLLELAKKSEITTAVETSGCAPFTIFEEIAPLVDFFLYDYKETDPEKHRSYTGHDNLRILENLRRLDSLGAKIILRCPIIPSYNDTGKHFAGIAAIASELKNLIRIDIEPYHNLVKRDTLRNIKPPEKETVDRWISELSKQTKVRVGR